MKKPKVIGVRPAGPDHQVISLKSSKTMEDNHLYRKEPCHGCPWKKENAGSFPAEAFKHSAETAYDMSAHIFSCHESGSEKPATCAGFLLNGSQHNMAVRLAYMNRKITNDFHDGGHEMFESYRAMAEANGVDPTDPRLAPCRE